MVHEIDARGGHQHDPEVTRKRGRQSSMQIITSVMLLGYFSLLFFGTHWPWLPARPDWFVVPDAISIAPDKMAHIIAFTILSLLVTLWIRARRRVFNWRHYAAIAAGLAAYAHFDEVTQYLVPRRTPDFYDLVANLTGIALGMTMFMVASWCVMAMRPKPTAWR